MRNVRIAICVFCALAMPFALLVLDAGEPAETMTKAVTIETADFLKAPAGLNAKDFTVAKTAPRVDVAFFGGLKDRGKGTLWSSWGDGCLATNGKYYTSVGDHLGTDANSYVYEYDPVRNVLKRVVDVLHAIGHKLGLFGYGKIHSGIHQGEDGKLYFATYWGKPKELDNAIAKGYPGSLLLRFDPATGKTENLGAIVPKQGLPASYFDPRGQLLFFHAVYKGDITVYDVKAEKVKLVAGGDKSAAHRTFMGDTKGRVWFSGTQGLSYYSPEKNALVPTETKLPGSGNSKKGDTLRAAAPRPTKAGVIYGMTAAGQMFAFDPEREEVKDLGPNFGKGDYTAVMALSPDEKYLYFAPGAHGSGTRSGVPVVQYEIGTGRRKVLAFLGAPLQKELSYQVGGTYNLQIDPSGERLFFTFNGAAPGARSAFGKTSVVVIHVPKDERN